MSFISFQSLMKGQEDTQVKATTCLFIPEIFFCL